MAENTGNYNAENIQVLEGMEAVHRAEMVRTNPWSNRPLRPVVMKKVTVDTRGVEYPEPEKA